MNTGIIASRYAAALLKLVDETGSGETVVSQARAILEAMTAVPDIRRLLSDPSIPAEKKLSLLETAVATGHPDACPEPVEGRSEGSLSPDLKQFFKLLVRNGRIGDIALILKSFEDQYFESRRIVRGRLTLSAEPDAAARKLESGIKKLIEERTGKTLLLSTGIDESLIGGFVLEIEDKLLDASVSHQLDIIRRQFVERNRRIV